MGGSDEAQNQENETRQAVSILGMPKEGGGDGLPHGCGRHFHPCNWRDTGGFGFF